MVYVAPIKHSDEKATWAGKGLFHPTTLRSQSLDEENQGRKVEAEGMEECCELTCSSWLALPGSYTIQDQPPRDGTAAN